MLVAGGRSGRIGACHLVLDKRTLRWVIQLYPSNSRVQMPCLICAGLVLAFCSALLSGCAVPHAASVDASTAGLPQIIAHRGGTGDAPENTLEAIHLALEHHADAMWLTVQLIIETSIIHDITTA
jgi:hypothetical protein